MAKNNNNAGMHFVKHSNFANYDNLSYYNKTSIEGIQNRKYNALAQLEEMGEYHFTKYATTIEVFLENTQSTYPQRYRVLIYEEQYEKQLRSVSTKRKLRNSNDISNVILVRVHDKQKVIYITESIYKKYIDFSTEYILD